MCNHTKLFENWHSEIVCEECEEIILKPTHPTKLTVPTTLELLLRRRYARPTGV